MPRPIVPPRLRAAPAKEQLAAGDVPARLKRLSVDPADVDAVLRDQGLGDARALLKMAAKRDDGDEVITRDELRRATFEAPGSVSYLDQVLGENDLVLETLAQLRALPASVG